jgi:hypothetical protein
MKVRFDFTLEDLVDSSERALSRSRTIRSLRMKSRLLSAFLCGVVVFLAKAGPPETKLLWAGIFAILAAAAHPYLVGRTRRRQLLKVFRERFSGPGPFTCEVELTSSGVTINQAGTQSTRPWSKIAEVKDAEDSIEIISPQTGFIVVRNRAFGSTEERRQFLELARKYAGASSASAGK